MDDYGPLNNWEVTGLVLVVAAFVLPALWAPLAAGFWYILVAAAGVGWVGIQRH